jgi:hypothetical protein
MGNAHKKGGLPARITLDAKWYIGNKLVAYGRKPADYDPAAFQGIHARYVLVMIRRGRRCSEVDLRCRRRSGHQHRRSSGGGRKP